MNTLQRLRGGSRWSLRRKINVELANCNESESTASNVTNTDSGSEFTDIEIEQFAIGDSDQNSLESDTDSDSDHEIKHPTIPMSKNLVIWATEYNISLAALSSLINNVLREDHPELPKDPRTLLKTQTSYNVKTVGGGYYHHFGLAFCVTKKICAEPDIYKNMVSLNIQINIDGQPLFKSSNVQFWPILGMIEVNNVKDPFIVGLFSGTSKPLSINEFLDDFIQEVLTLEQYGITVQDKTFAIKISAVICDAPARSYVKQIKPFNAYHGCERCTQEGVWDGKVTFPLVDSPLRTDDSVRDMTDGEHHKGLSPFVGTSVRLVSQFPLDYMHLCCLGVMRKLIKLWMKGPLKCRLGGNTIKLISVSLNTCKCSVPTEFARKPRGLEEIDRWKATEFRQFLLYTGPVVLYNKLPAVFYCNFLLFHIAMVLLLRPNSNEAERRYAGVLLKLFVQHYSELYGKELVVYNIHCLIHLVDDALNYGSLNTVSAFPFENFLGSLKKMIRKPHLPLQQVIRRVSEGLENHKTAKMTEEVILKQQHNSGPILEEFQFSLQYKEVNLHLIKLKVTKGDNCILINGDISVIHNILADHTNKYLVISSFQNKQNFFVYPVQSSQLGIYKVSNLSADLKVVSLPKNPKKYVLLPHAEETYVAIPLLHC